MSREIKKRKKDERIFFHLSSFSFFLSLSFFPHSFPTSTMSEDEEEEEYMEIPKGPSMSSHETAIAGAFMTAAASPPSTTSVPKVVSLSSIAQKSINAVSIPSTAPVSKKAAEVAAAAKRKRKVVEIEEDVEEEEEEDTEEDEDEPEQTPSSSKKNNKKKKTASVPEKKLNFRFTFNQPELLVNLVNAIGALVVEANMNITEDNGIDMQSFDSSGVAMFELSVLKTIDPKFLSDGNHVIGIHMPTLMIILSTVDLGRCFAVTLRQYVGQEDVMEIVSSYSTEEDESLLKLMDIDSQPMGIPDIEPIGTVSMSSLRFQKIMVKKFTKLKCDVVDIKVLKNGVVFTGSGSENSNIGDSKVTIIDTPFKEGTDVIDFCEVSHNSDITSHLAARFVTNFARGSTISDFVRIIFYKDMPAKFVFKRNEFVTLTYFLAERINEDQL